MTDAGTKPTASELGVTLAEAATVLGEMGRDDLRTRVDAASVRFSRPNTVVCVVGEFKQGKSSLVNGLIGTDVCPVDDDIATAVITLVRHGDEPSAIIRRRGPEGPSAEPVALETVATLITERAHQIGAEPEEADRIERIDILTPSPLLRDGLVLVDTPGMGGLGAGHAAATLSFLPFADGLLFVSDATSELTATEIDFLEQARERCPAVLMVGTKIDMAPAWRDLRARDEAHLAARDIDATVIPVSSALRAAAFAERDRDLNERSGYPALLETLENRIVAPAAERAAERAVVDTVGAIDTAVAALDLELAALDDPDRLIALRAEAAAATTRLDELRRGGASWQTALNDRITDLTTDVNHRFRGTIRTTTRNLEERIENLKTGEEWDELARELQTVVAAAITDAFAEAEAGRVRIRTELATTLAADDVVGTKAERAVDGVDIGALWRARELDPSESDGGKAFRTGLTGLRGAQSGVLMLGMTSQFLPQAAGLFIASNPVLLGAGALFGGYQLVEDRKRKLQARRQAARTQLRQFTDDVQFEVANDLTRLLRDVHRDLRDEFVELIGELQQSWVDAARHAQEAADAGEQAMSRRRQQGREQRQRLIGIRATLTEADR